MNISRINSRRERMWHCALQSGRGEIFRSLSTIIRSISAIVFVLIDRTPLIAGQVHSGRKVQLDTWGSDFASKVPVAVSTSALLSWLLASVSFRHPSFRPRIRSCSGSTRCGGARGH